MPSPRAALVVLALLGSLSACGDSDPDPSSLPSTAPLGTVAPSASADTTPSAEPSASATPESPETRTDCGSSKVVPDGTWQGPITMTVRGNGGNGFADSRGTGQLTLTVADGTVTSGRWTLTWTSHGEARTPEAAATIDLTGTVRGSAKGTARTPVLPHTWRIKGTAHVTRPVTTSSPIDETGRGSDRLTIASSSCDQVHGTFAPSFTSKDAAATFTVTADWVATRQ